VRADVKDAAARRRRWEAREGVGDEHGGVFGVGVYSRCARSL
jgi:hypothetical protein